MVLRTALLGTAIINAVAARASSNREAEGLMDFIDSEGFTFLANTDSGSTVEVRRI